MWVSKPRWVGFTRQNSREERGMKSEKAGDYQANSLPYSAEY